jgi:hypothetical protein
MVKVGPFARGGKCRVATKAADHDFQPAATVTPVGMSLSASHEFFLYEVTSRVNSDCLVHCLIDWWQRVRVRFPHIHTLLINVDNEWPGESPSAYPAYAAFVGMSGILSTLSWHIQAGRTVPGDFGATLQWVLARLRQRGDPVCQHDDWERETSRRRLGTGISQSGVTLTREAMDAVETQLQRLPSLKKWFVDMA